jgi:hypothetical protein
LHKSTSYDIFIEDGIKKWNIIYLLHIDKIIKLKKIINDLYQNEEYNKYKSYVNNNTIYDKELQEISIITDIHIDQLYFYNNILSAFLYSTSCIIENYERIIQITQYESTIKVNDFMISLCFYKSKSDKKPLFSACSFFGYIGIICAKNNYLNVSINFDRNPIKYNLNNIDPGYLLRSIYEESIEYKKCKNIILNSYLKYNCKFVITSKKKFRIIEKGINSSKFLNNIYYLATETLFIITTSFDKQYELEKKMIEILKRPIDVLTKFEVILYDQSSIKMYVENYLLNYFFDKPFLSDNTLFFCIFSITDNFYNIYCPK